ncbi:MAG: glycosyltransferase [Nitrososphaera sp.]
MDQKDTALVQFYGLDRISVVVPHIPPRARELTRAVASLMRQTLPANVIKIVTDNNHHGSAITRNRGLHLLDTPWVAFLDDDDELLPNHLATLAVAAARELDAGNSVGVVYPGCLVVDAWGQIIQRQEEWGRFGQPFNPELLREKSYIPVTSLVHSTLAQKAQFGPPTGVETTYDDWGFYLRLLDLGARFIHVPQETWVWHHHGENTSGQPDRW